MIKTEIFLSVGYTAADIKKEVCERLPIKIDEISDPIILKKALDLSDKANPRYRTTVGIELSEEREAGLLKMKKKVSAVEDFSLNITHVKPNNSPIVVGSGPAGLFAALILCEAGTYPIVLERGLDVDSRKAKVDAFNKFGILDTECNIQFGEGGAGTFSDGKLKVGGMDKYKLKVLREFCNAGADEEIIYTVGAHLGTDKLSEIVKKIREKIINLGGKFIFGAKLTEIIIKEEKITGIVYKKDGRDVRLDADNVVLAIGHSAKDTFEALYSAGVKMEAKGFGIGVRIEHPREYINELVYGKNYDSRLGTGSYHLVTHLKNGRSVYSFCMCPGGTVVAAASEEGGIVTNGMSEYLRDGENSNAAFLVSLTPCDFKSEHPLAGMRFQREIESRAFHVCGEDYKAPAIRLCDFLDRKRKSEIFPVNPSYPRGVVSLLPDEYFPDYISESLRKSIDDFEKWIPGFLYPDSVLTGCETRSTSPVRILRDNNLTALGIFGLYPAGEGAGYSGGIVSSAVDGVKCALSLIENFKHN